MLTLPGAIAAGADQPAAFVSAQACAGCHTAQFDAWKGSHHALAMQLATTATVLGDIADARLEHFGVTTTFYRNSEKFMVRTDCPDGALHDYPIAYTFGVYPLQQYLIAFLGGGCRRSALPGTAGQKSRAANDGSSSTPASSSSPAIHCTGLAETRPGTTSAPTATPLI
jgi:hypothetical protein